MNQATPAVMPNGKRQLLEALSPDVPGIVKQLVAEDRSWRQIRDHLRETKGIEVSHESLRQWYGGAA